MQALFFNYFYLYFMAMRYLLLPNSEFRQKIAVNETIVSNQTIHNYIGRYARYQRL